MAEGEQQTMYNPELLAKKARELARNRNLTREKHPIRSLYPILENAMNSLKKVYRILSVEAQKDKELTPAGEWLLDNFYIIQEQIIQVMEDLPKSYYRELPRIKEGPFKGYPRVYEIIYELAGLTDNVIDIQNIEKFVKAYQEEDLLTLGELWAIPLMSKLVLIQQLQKKSKLIIENRKDRKRALDWAQRFTEAVEKKPSQGLKILIMMAETLPTVTPDFLVKVANKLQSEGKLLELQRTWLEWQFKEWNTTLEEESRKESQHESKLQLSVQNAVISLRKGSEARWSDFVEKSSIVERSLRLDPAGVYPKMDFGTRDRYRKRVEKLSKYSDLTEFEVAEQVLLHTEKASSNGMKDVHGSNHVGYYLIRDGYPILEKAIQYSPPWSERIKRFIERHSSVYILINIVTALVLTSVPLFIARSLGAPFVILGILAAVSLIPGFDVAIAMVNRVITLLLPPRILPKMDFGTEIPDSEKTLVVVPTLISSVKDANKQVEQLEIRALANTDKNIRYALLTDFLDAPEKNMPSDDETLKAATTAVKELNRKYNDGQGDRFFLLHRERMWNESQNCWMGWERKRGKIEELNSLLRQPKAETTYATIEGDFFGFTNHNAVKYVITLDADTRLPPGSAFKLIRTAAHPLNMPVFDEQENRVVKGYGVLQPRISITPSAAVRTHFAKIFSGNIGLDPYTTAVSDVYQDLFAEGSFTGKGLYHVDAFRQAFEGKLPENTILSHDLLEGNYVRTALVTDIELFDDYPTNYLAFSQRFHRWARGDWQIVRWLFGTVPTKEGNERNSLHLLARWKIFDNLRRSLNPQFLLLLLLLDWTLLPGSTLIWTLAVLGVLAFPIYSNFSTDIFRRPARVAWKLYIDKILNDLKNNSLQAALTLTVLVHQAFMLSDAILKTLGRLIFTRRNLLEWTSASQTELKTRGNLENYLIVMRSSILWGIFSILLTSIMHPTGLLIAVPFGILWIAAPFLIWYISKPIDYRKKELSDDELTTLRLYMRRTWMYFEKLVNEEHSWLPPDNLQEEPAVSAAARTSPTNIGLSLVSTQIAYDFGFITRLEMLERLDHMTTSMSMLERYRGHFYNWYSTKVGEVLHPRYISTVDSGNLASCLITLIQSLREVEESTWPNPYFFDGLRDTQTVLEETTNLLIEYANGSESITKMKWQIDRLNTKIPNQPIETITGFWESLNEMRPCAEAMSRVSMEVLRGSIGDLALEEIEYWFSRPLNQIDRQREELLAVFPDLETDVSSIPEELNAPQKLKTLRKQFSSRIPAISAHVMEKDINAVEQWVMTVQRIIDRCEAFINEMDFAFLYDNSRDLFYIGFNEDRSEADSSTYDLLASEARLASFIAIAKGDVPARHWFQLSRRLTAVNRSEILLSWGGTMFEYLMPLLFMRRYEGTMLDETYDNVVEWHKNYGEQRKKPWGFSESAYFGLNIQLDYQYRTFGAPGLGLRRGLAEEYVVAPYATMLALMINPASSFENLKKLQEENAYGFMGFYEAVDYTQFRLPPTQDVAVVQSYMAHHQGMSMVALANVLKEDIMQNRFHSSALVRSCELLLQERIPRAIPVTNYHPIEIELEPAESESPYYAVDYIDKEQLFAPVPRVHLLSNGNYTTMITNAGTGYSAFKHIALTRWKGDRIREDEGLFIYIKDLDNKDYWSLGYQPAEKNPDRYEGWFQPGKVEMARVDNWIESFVEICVSPEENIELRRITLTNYQDKARKLELTSYAEVVLNEMAADAAHPAYSKLFVQTDYLPEHHSLLAHRRPRSPDEETKWMLHTMASHDIDNLSEPLQFETDRNQFIGRGRSLKRPRAMDEDVKLSGSVGSVLDPVLSLRRIVELNPGEKMQITFGLGWAEDRRQAEEMADRYDNPYAVDRVFELSKVHGNVELEHLNMTGKQVIYFQQMAGSILYDNPATRASEEILMENRLQQPKLWAYGISGDLPIVVVRIKQMDEIKTAEKMIKAHAFWRFKNLTVDLVFINDHPASYADEIQEALIQAVQISPERNLLNKRGGIFILRGDDMDSREMALILSVARIIITGKLPKVDELTDIEREMNADDRLKSEVKFKPASGTSQKEKESSEMKAQKGSQKEKPKEKDVGQNQSVSDDMKQYQAPSHLFNGYGGFNEDGTEYIIQVLPDEKTGQLKLPPAPWINVIANEQFGCMVTEKGSGNTWSQNSRENRLTPWSNDPVSDPADEAFYIRDEDAGEFWSPMPGPCPSASPYEVRHGFGYSTFRHKYKNLEQETTIIVPRKDPLKLIRLRLTNSGKITRHVSVYRYQTWVQGVLKKDSSRYVTTRFKEDTRALYAENFYNNEFAGRTAFALFHLDEHQPQFTANRLSFIGRNQDMESPRALQVENPLDGKTGAGLDPCAAFRFTLKLEPGENIDLLYLTGETGSEQEADRLIEKYTNVEAFDNTLREVKQYWKETLSVIQVETPEPEINMMVNGWLLYQNLSCRIWGRSAFYQSGGAYGFRDQLQDVLALLFTKPEITRDQLLLHAGKQFKEGDVLHWWHPPTGRGIRSHISDDLLWLPYATALYVNVTGDTSVLDEVSPFIEARALEEGEHEAYLTPTQSEEKATLYEHCCRALNHAMTKGPHGLPLMGTGDWNDGMNLVGHEGKGESVWLGFFIYDILEMFVPISKERKDEQRTQHFTAYKEHLHTTINEQGWDGKWYRRAYYDDGTPLGSAENDECQIDALAQSWSVISGVATPDRAREAMKAVEERLISREQEIIRLLTPAFDRTEHNPGYIKGYIPGVRENGGQYTHAAVWVVKALAKMSEGNKAGELLKMLMPSSHASTEDKANRYKVEPYAVAADVYGENPHIGRGGWTWYTGSAGWLYRVAVESVLGLQLHHGDTLTINPSIPGNWDNINITYRIPGSETVYEIKIKNPDNLESGVKKATMDGKGMETENGMASLPVVDDGKRHKVEIHLGLFN